MKEEGRCHPDTTNAEKQQSIYMNKISKKYRVATPPRKPKIS